MGPSGPIFFCKYIGAISFCFETAPFYMVDATGLEPVTPCTSSRYSNQLS